MQFLGSTHFKCRVCAVDLKGGLTEVQRHDANKKHRKNQKACPMEKVSIFLKTEQDHQIETQVKKNEIRLAMFLLEHNLPITVADHLVEFLKSCDQDSRKISRMSCSRTKCTAIINNVIGMSSFDSVVSLLRKNKFSLIIDESNDRSTTKHLVLVARMIVEGNVHDVFAGLLTPTDYTAEGIFNVIVDFFNTNEIPYRENLVGFASDGANVMMGGKNSVVTRFKSEIPNIFIQKCICHSLALCCSHACSMLPQDVESLVKGVYLYVKYSAKRMQSLQQIQLQLEMPKHRLLNTSNTRWLSIRNCVTRFLEQHDAIVKLLHNESQENLEAKQLYEKVRNPVNILYLKFLDFILPLITDRNQEFQAEKPLVSLLYSKMETLYRSILELYIDERFLEGASVRDIQYRNPENFVKLDKVDLGPRVNAEIRLLNIAPALVTAFRTKCLNFLTELARQIYSRFPFRKSEIDILQYTSFIVPSNIIDVKSISPLVSFLGLDIVKIDAEYKNFRRHFKNDVTIDDPDRFWNKVRNCKTGNDELMYPHILDLYDRIRIFPHSSAACEIIFSVVTMNKTSYRNRMEDELLNSILYGKDYLNMHNEFCYNFKVNSAFLTKHNVHMYSHKQ